MVAFLEGSEVSRVIKFFLKWLKFRPTEKGPTFFRLTFLCWDHRRWWEWITEITRYACLGRICNRCLHNMSVGAAYTPYWVYMVGWEHTITAYKNGFVEEELVITPYDARGILIKKRVLEFLSIDIITRGYYENYRGLSFSLLAINLKGQIRGYLWSYDTATRSDDGPILLLLLLKTRCLNLAWRIWRVKHLTKARHLLLIV